MLEQSKNAYRRYALAGATICIAISIGFLMQASEPSYAGHSLPKATVTPIPDAAVPAHLPKDVISGLEDFDDLSSLPTPPEDKTQNAVLPDQPIVLLVAKDTPVGSLPTEESAPAMDCKVSLMAEPGAAAMIDLTLEAPCLTGERATFHHSGLKFTGIVGADGVLKVVLPALSEQALIVVAFANGDGAVARAEVDSLPFYDRVAVQWKGSPGLQLHALEFGAAYGEDGHVWSGRPRGVAAVSNGQGGFLTQLGDASSPEALMAEIYTFPTGTARTQGAVAISVEVEISEANCMRDVSAQSIEVLNTGGLRVQDLAISLPDCDAVGEFLVLKNLLEDLTIARN